MGGTLTSSVGCLMVDGEYDVLPLVVGSPFVGGCWKGSSVGWLIVGTLLGPERAAAGGCFLAGRLFIKPPGFLCW